MAVLLVTKNLLASQFIFQEEPPALLPRAKANELKLIWIAVGHAAYAATELFKPR